MEKEYDPLMYGSGLPKETPGLTISIKENSGSKHYAGTRSKQSRQHHISFSHFDEEGQKHVSQGCVNDFSRAQFQVKSGSDGL